MPLSEHEQRLLDQMEQALYEEDPKFVSHMHASHSRVAGRRRILLGAVAVVAGLAVVLLGVTKNLIWVGAIGFAIMVAGGAYAAMPRREATTPLASVQPDGSLKAITPQGSASARSRLGALGGKPGAGSRGSAKPSGTFMERLEERWERRRYDSNW